MLGGDVSYEEVEMSAQFPGPLGQFYGAGEGKVMKPKVIGLVGRARSGKSTAAEILRVRWDYGRTRFAGPLKDMLRAIGMTEEEIEGSEKFTPKDWLCGKTPRHAMQTLGTEWGRDCLGKDFWARLLVRRLTGHAAHYVVEDVRFLNEAKAIKDLGGVIIRLNRLVADVVRDPHYSELEMADIVPVYRIKNDGTITDLEWELDKVLELYEESCGKINA